MDGEPLPQPTSEHGASPCAQSESVVALLLEGQPSLGAYQGGVLRALREGGPAPCRVCGAALGACYAVLIAGNRPDERLARVREFSAAALALGLGARGAATAHRAPTTRDLWANWLESTLDAGRASESADRRLRALLLRLVDFARLNGAETRLSLAARDQTTGRITWFDNTEDEITPEHVLTSLHTPIRSGREGLTAALGRTAAKASVLPIALDPAERKDEPNGSLFALIYGRALASARAPALA